MHYPTLHLLDATLPEDLPAYDLWLLALTLTVCFVFAAVFERPLGTIRARVLPLWKALCWPISAARSTAP
ncbi:hypothetical protein [Roseobacter sinensis]|uniref:Uncharacterized protein n=1 Tax=Roseobacter sinensis TaxID=2931391 RepID=A0ABT3BDM9_9RHOB|nr:hypothetical protein [Roseobacter sp. WL0113]MCV3271687.1 hypothetical protein [Roseobacter sp. WL0113]